MNYNAVMNY
ncbi:hypothetical protein YPPY52_2754, partial [Yersinia pestis PY-52]